MPDPIATPAGAMARGGEFSPLTALVYVDGSGAGELMRRTARALTSTGLACAGLLQHDELCEGRSRCDMVLENIETGERTRISQDRGPLARGCRLDPDALIAAMGDVGRALGSHTRVLLLSKFGKSEAEGGGFRPLIADALERGIPVVIGVPRHNLDNWRTFAGGLGRELVSEALETMTDDALLATLGGVLGGHAALHPDDDWPAPKS